MRFSLFIFLFAVVASASTSSAFTLHTSARVEIVPVLEVRDARGYGGSDDADVRIDDGNLGFLLSGPEHLCVHVVYASGEDRPPLATGRYVHDADGRLEIALPPVEAGRPVLSLIYE